MKKFEGALLCSDFDNTLAPSLKYLSRGLPLPEIPAENLAAVRYWMDNGGRFAVVTGRAYPAYLHIQPKIPTNAPTVLFNGAGIYDFAAGAYVHRCEMPDSLPADTAELLAAFPRTGFEIFLWDERVYAYQPNAFIERHQRYTNAPWREVRGLDEVEEPPAKLLFEDEYETLLTLQAFLRARPWFSRYETIFSGPHLLELTARGANKGGAVARLARGYGIPRERVFCAGDEENDLSMLESAAAAFVPADASPALLRPPFCVVGPCTEHAVADAVELLDRRLTAPEGER